MEDSTAQVKTRTPSKYVVWYESRNGGDIVEEIEGKKAVNELINSEVCLQLRVVWQVKARLETKKVFTI